MIPAQAGFEGNTGDSREKTGAPAHAGVASVSFVFFVVNSIGLLNTKDTKSTKESDDEAFDPLL